MRNPSDLSGGRKDSQSKFSVEIGVPHTVLSYGIGELVKLVVVVKYEVKYYYYLLITCGFMGILGASNSNFGSSSHNLF